jgi:anti-anti-sigma factor
MGWEDRHLAYHALRTVLQALRDWLPVDEAAALGAQLPLLIRGFYYEHWHPHGKPVKGRKESGVPGPRWRRKGKSKALRKCYRRRFATSGLKSPIPCGFEQAVAWFDRKGEAMMTSTQPASAAGIFEIEQQGDTLIVVPATDLRELDYERIEAGARGILQFLKRGSNRKVILDFERTDYYGSTALGFFVKLWKTLCRSNGRMAFCNVSEHEREILRITHLDELWPICASRREALEAVKR